MRALLRAIAGGCLALWPGVSAVAHADPTDPPTHAGVQPAPPIRAAEPTLRQELDGRRSIRGCSVDERCARPGDLLREFEAEAFPAPGASPWIDERKLPTSRLEAGPSRPIVKRPSELRPDAPWLDQLELPDLPIRWSQTLVDYLVFYKDDPRGRSIMASWLVAQGRYRDMIVSHLRKARLPEDLLYVAMIESGYDPNDSSSAGALGVWQFMPEGGRIYGLREDRWVDERRDPLRSTIAQMDYFADLHQRFADWHVALAAFNMGYGAMLRSIARYNTNDYYRLCEYENAIPWETCLYTPKILAAAIVGHNRAFYGYDKLTPLPAEVWEEVTLPTSASLAAVARIAGASEAEVKRLNPQLRHGRTPPGEAGYVVRVPAGTRAETQRRIAELEADWRGYDAYVIAHGERFEDVATTFGTTVGQLRKLNDVSREAEIEGGTVLVVPRIAADQRAKNQAKARANLHASGVDQKGGEPLLVPVPDKAAVVDGKRRVFYRVIAGDTLRGVARALAVAQAELAQWNALDPEGNLQPRMVLQAWVAPGFDPAKHAVNLLDEAQLLVVTRGSPEHMDLAEARTGRVRTEYVAQGKEKLADVARKFGMGSHDLARINRISYDTTLTKGQAIIVYQVADPNRSKRADEQWRKTPRARRGKLAGSHAARTASANQPDREDSDADGDADADGEADAVPPEGKRPEAGPADGKISERGKPDGDSAEAKGLDGKKVEGRSADGKKLERRSLEGKAAEGRSADSKKLEGRSLEGKKAEGRSLEGKAAERRSADGKEGKEGKPAEGPSPEGKKASKKADGRGGDGKKPDGKSSDASRPGAAKGAGRPTDGRSSSAGTSEASDRAATVKAEADRSAPHSDAGRGDLATEGTGPVTRPSQVR